MEKKILIVDPVYTRLLLERTCLSRKEYKLFTTTKGLEGLEIARKEKPHLIFFSTDLKDIDGIEFCKKIREWEDTKKTSLLLIVAKEKDEIVNKIMSSGCNDYITFPLNRLILDQKLEVYLNIATRKSLRVMVQIKIETKSSKGLHLGTSVNISKSGMLLETHISIPLFEEIFLKFFLPKIPQQIETKAKVVREEVFKNLKRYGIKFIDLEPSLGELIDDFVKKN